MYQGLLKIAGILDLTQFWPEGESDADTANLKVDVAGSEFTFKPSATEPARTTRVYEGAFASGRYGPTPVIKTATVRMWPQVIDAPELHLPVDAAIPKSKQTKSQCTKFLEINHEHRQPLGGTAAIRFRDFPNQGGQQQIRCRVRAAAILCMLVLAGCSDGGGGQAPVSGPASQPQAQPDILVATPTGLLRSQVDGQGQRVLTTVPAPNPQQTFVSNGNIYYSRPTQTPGSADVWTVHTDGTGDHALLNTVDDESVRAVSRPWLIYAKFTPSGEEHWSLRLDTLAQFLLDVPVFGNTIQFQNANRVILGGEPQISSITTTGTDRIILASLTQQERDQEATLLGPWIVADALVYRRVTATQVLNSSNIFAVPLDGGTAVPLDSEQAYTYFAGSIGARVVYQRCTIEPSALPCDVASVQNDGTNRVVLAAQPANEATQGVTTNQVIIRRNLNGHDQLIAVPVTGGPEILLMTMTNDEFVDLIVGDLLILRRPSGTWSLTLNGTLTQLTTVAKEDGFRAVGSTLCLNRQQAVWCLPLDGQGSATKITDEGEIVATL